MLGEGVDFALYPLNNPGIISIPLGFFLGWLGSVLTSRKEDPKLAAEMSVRSMTGHGAEQAVEH
jgi:cation/acetate symporter